MRKLFKSLLFLLILLCFTEVQAKFDIKARTVILQDFLSGKILYEISQFLLG